MVIYLLESADAAKMCRQLLQLSDGCSLLQWSKNVKNIPTDVLNSLEIIQDFVNEKVYEYCGQNRHAELSSQGVDYIDSLSQKSDYLKKTLGSGVVLAGEESDKVLAELTESDEIKSVIEALNSGKNLVIL